MFIPYALTQVEQTEKRIAFLTINGAATDTIQREKQRMEYLKKVISQKVIE